MNIDKALEVLEERKKSNEGHAAAYEDIAGPCEEVDDHKSEARFYEAVAEVVREVKPQIESDCDCKICVTFRNLVRAVEGLR
jgi:hypothetical protein